MPAVVECGLGFVVAWNEQAPGAQPQLKLRTFDQDTLSGPESQVSTAEVEPLIRPAMARLTDGGFVVVWADKRQDERIRAQRFTFEGTKNGPEFRANTIAGLHRVPMVAGLVNGNIVIGRRARLPGPLLVHLQIFDANGPVGGAALASEASGQRGDSMVRAHSASEDARERADGTRPEPGSSAREQTTSLDITEAAMTALESGRFVIAHIRTAFDGEPGFETTIAQASVYEASGAFANIRFAATAAPRIQSSWPTLAPLPGGRFLLAWTELNVDNVAAGINVKARMFSPAQGPIGQVTQFNTRRAASDSACVRSRWRLPSPPGRTTVRAAAILRVAPSADGRYRYHPAVSRIGG